MFNLWDNAGYDPNAFTPGYALDTTSPAYGFNALVQDAQPDHRFIDEEPYDDAAELARRLAEMGY